MHQTIRRSMRWVYGSVALCLVAVAGARAIRSQSTVGATNQPQPKPPSTASAGAVLSVESAAERDGLWFVVDARAHRIHVLDSLGRRLTSFGKKGRGPGEFITPMIVARSATHTYVAEMARADISVFDAAGQFSRHLRVRGPCEQGNVAAMGVSGSTLYVLRRCVELPARIRLQLERSSDGARLAVWSAAADATPIPQNGALPIHIPVMAVSDTRLILGDGAIGCVRMIRLPDGAPQGSRCFSEVPRQALPAEERQRLQARWRGRIAVPDSLPRFMAIVLRDSLIAAQIPETAETTSWIELSWRANHRVRGLGSGPVPKSFLGARTQLIATEDVDGMRFQVVPIAR